MSRIFVGQTAVYIEVKVYQDITGASELLIKYKKPNGETGSFPGTSTDDINGYFRYYPISEEDLDQVGRWVFWASVTFANGKSAAGEPTECWIYPEGQVLRN